MTLNQRVHLRESRYQNDMSRVRNVRVVWDKSFCNEIEGGAGIQKQVLCGALDLTDILPPVKEIMQHFRKWAYKNDFVRLTEVKMVCFGFEVYKHDNRRGVVESASSSGKSIINIGGVDSLKGYPSFVWDVNTSNVKHDQHD